MQGADQMPRASQSFNYLKDIVNIAAIVGILGCVSIANPASAQEQLSENKASQVNVQTNGALMPNGRPMVAEFGATWCGPCKRFAPTYEKISHTYADRADFATFDIDQRPDIASHYKVAYVPTVLILDVNGKVKWRHSGILTEQELSKSIEKVTHAR
jgi:thioredoxin 1